MVKYKVRKIGVKTSLVLSNVIDADHQNSCLFTNKGHFSSSLCVLISVLAKFYSNTLPIALTIFILIMKNVDPHDHYIIMLHVVSLLCGCKRNNSLDFSYTC